MPTKFDLENALTGWRATKASTLSPYCGVYGGCPLKPVPDDVLVLNGDIKAVALLDEKVYAHELFHRSDMLHYRPASKVYWKQYHSSLAADICASVPGDTVMIKTSDCCRGDGVYLIKKSELDYYLRVLLEDESGIQSQLCHFAKGLGVDTLEQNAKQIEAWRRTSRMVFLAEEVVASKPVQYRGAMYNPTMRVVFLMYDILGHDETVIEPLSYYWKFPTEPISAVQRRSNVVSSFEIGAARRGEVDTADRVVVYAALVDFLPSVVRLAQSLPYDTPLQSLHSLPAFSESNQAGAQRKQSDIMKLYMANSAGQRGEYAHAIYSIYDYMSRHPNDNMGLYEMATIHMLSGDYDKAIKQFEGTTGYNLQYYRIASCYRMKKDKKNALLAWKKIPERSDPRVQIERKLIDEM
jgi:tetratricopeptide (TPR) repeat protein